LRPTYKIRGQNNPSRADGTDAADELRLLVPWSNPLAVFAGNVIDYVLRRVVPGFVTTSAPDHGFWRNIDVRTPFPRRGLFDSVLAHTLLLGQ